jgi:hypothetical protein
MVKRGKLEEKKMKKKAHVGARADAAARGRSQRLRNILVLRICYLKTVEAVKITHK